MVEYFEITPTKVFHGIKEGISHQLRETICGFGKRQDLNETRLDPELVTLKTNESKQKFIIQRTLLENSSPYFRALLYKKYGGKYVAEIIIADMETDTLAKIVHFILSGKCQITSSNVTTLMVAASRLCVDELVVSCSRFLLSNMTYINCIGIRTFAQNYNFIDLVILSHAFFMDNYRSVLQNSDNLTDLTMIEIRQLCSKWHTDYPEDENNLAKWLDDFLFDFLSDSRRNNLVKYDLPGCEHKHPLKSELPQLYMKIQEEKEEEEMKHSQIVWNIFQYTLIGVLVGQGLQLIYNGFLRR